MELTPLFFTVEKATDDLSKALISLQSAVNEIGREEQTNSALRDSGEQIRKIEQEITQLKRAIQTSKVGQAFMKVNEKNIERQVEYLNQRLKFLNNQVAEVDKRITIAIDTTKTTTTSNKDTKGWWIFTEKMSHTHTTRVEGNVQGLKDEREALLLEIEKTRKTITKVSRNNVDFQKEFEMDVSDKENRFQVCLTELKKLQEGHNLKVSQLIRDKLRTAGVSPEGSSTLMDLVLVLGDLLKSFKFLLVQMDSNAHQVKETLQSNVLKPQVVLSSIAHVYKYSIMYNVMAISSFGVTGGRTFDNSYKEFFGKIGTVTRVSIEKAPVEKVVEKDAELSKEAADEDLMRQLGFI